MSRTLSQPGTATESAYRRLQVLQVLVSPP